MKAEWMTPSLVEADDTTQREKKKKKNKARRAEAAPDAPGRGNPRFIVTSADKTMHEARAGGARGEMDGSTGSP